MAGCADVCADVSADTRAWRWMGHFYLGKPVNSHLHFVFATASDDSNGNRDLSSVVVVQYSHPLDTWLPSSCKPTARPPPSTTASHMEQDAP